MNGRGRWTLGPRLRLFGEKSDGQAACKAILAVVVLALAARVLYVLLFVQHLEYPDFSNSGGVGLSYDEFYYAEAARELADGHVFQLDAFVGTRAHTALHPPATSFALTPAAIIGSGDLGMRITGALAGAATVGLVALLAMRLGGPRAGVLAAVIAALYPNLWVNDGLLLSETYTALATIVVLLLAIRLWSRPTLRCAAAFGVACGIAALTRSELLLLLPLLVLPVVASGWATRRIDVLRLLSVALAAALLSVAPWIAYNLSRFEQPVLITTGDGPTLSGANCDSTYRGPGLGFWNGFCGPRPRDAEDESVHSEKSRNYALRYMRNHVTRLPVVVAARVGRVWSLFRNAQMIDRAESEGKPRWATWGGWFMMYLVVVPLAVVGGRRLRAERQPLLPLLAPVLLVFITAAAFYGRERFRVPAEVSFVVLAGIGGSVLLERMPTPGVRSGAHAS